MSRLFVPIVSKIIKPSSLLIANYDFFRIFFTIFSWISSIYHRWKVHCYCDLQTLHSRSLFLYDLNLFYTQVFFCHNLFFQSYLKKQKQSAIKVPAISGRNPRKSTVKFINSIFNRHQQVIRIFTLYISFHDLSED